MSALDLQRYKENLIAIHLRTFPFDKNNEEQVANAKKLLAIIEEPCSINDIVAVLSNQAVFGKNKNSLRGYALFTKEWFYGIDIYERPVSCKLKDIKDIITPKPQKKSLFASLVGELFDNGYCGLKTNTGNTFHIADSVGKKMKGIALINGLVKADDTPYRQYQISQTTRVFGEIVEVILSRDERKNIEAAVPQGAAQLVQFCCKLTRLTIDGAYFEIVIKDKDIKTSEYPNAIYTEEEWKCGVSEYIASAKVREVYQLSILRSLGLIYTLEQIYFEANVKITVGTYIAAAGGAAQNAFDKMKDITEDRMIDAIKEHNKN